MYCVFIIIIIKIIIIILDAIYALFLKSSKRGALCQHERSRVTHNTQQTLNTYTDKLKHTHVVQRQGECY
jgi:hypothetical protein